jgi:hypothetical protein
MKARQVDRAQSAIAGRKFRASRFKACVALLLYCITHRHEMMYSPAPCIPSRSGGRWSPR